MYCPSCRAEFVDGVTHCANCDVELVAELPDFEDTSSPDAMAKSLADKDLEAVLVGNHVALQEAQRRMAKAGIASVIAGEADEVGSGMHARFFLMVDSARLGDAGRFFERQRQEGLEIEGVMVEQQPHEIEQDTCPACQSAMPDGAAECPECGLFLGEPQSVE